MSLSTKPIIFKELFQKVTIAIMIQQYLGKQPW
jgi:hypothetical protein